MDPMGYILYNVRPPATIAKLVNITPRTMIYGTQIAGGPHIVWLGDGFSRQRGNKNSDYRAVERTVGTTSIIFTYIYRNMYLHIHTHIYIYYKIIPK